MIRPASASPDFHRVEDLIERHNDVLEFAEIKLQREISARHLARERDRAAAQASARISSSDASDVEAVRLAADHHRAVAIAHARAARQERVTIAHIGIGVNRDRGDVEFAAHRALVQRLNIFEPMFESVAAQIDLVFRHRVKHEGVIRIGRMAEGENVRVRTASLRA